MKLLSIVAFLSVTSQLTSSLLVDVDKEPSYSAHEYSLRIPNVNDVVYEDAAGSADQLQLQQNKEHSEPQRSIDVKQRTSRPQGCPAHFVYLPSVRGCYKVVTDILPWTNAALRCRTLDSNAHLLIVNDGAEQRAVVEDLVKWYTGCGWGMWTAGQRANPGIPYSDFVWKIVTGYECPRMLEMTYKHWKTGEPSSDSNGSESCMHLRQAIGYMWNDLACSYEQCSVCEIDM